jgi:hypothetical protein
MTEAVKASGISITKYKSWLFSLHLPWVYGRGLPHPYLYVDGDFPVALDFSILPIAATSSADPGPL